MRPGTDHQSNTPKPHHHHRFPGPLHLLPADQRWQGVCQICPRLHPFPGLSAHPQGDLYERRLSDPPLPLCPGSPGWPHHLAHPVHLMQGGLHGLATLRPTLSPHEPRCGSAGLDRHSWWPQLGMVCHHLPYLPHGPLSLDLRPGTTQPYVITGDEASSKPLTRHFYPDAPSIL
jgi:hypothetical protein